MDENVLDLTRVSGERSWRLIRSVTTSIESSEYIMTTSRGLVPSASFNHASLSEYYNDAGSFIFFCHSRYVSRRYPNVSQRPVVVQRG